jgi:hypothetical protein
LLARELAGLAIATREKAQAIASRLGIEPLPDTSHKDPAYQGLLEARALDAFLGSVLDSLPQPAASQADPGAQGEDQPADPPASKANKAAQKAK